MAFSLESFEVHAYRRELEAGMRELMALLRDLDAHYGRTGDAFEAEPLRALGETGQDQNVWARAASAASALLADRQLRLAPQWRQHILAHNRWLTALLAATPLHNADHVLRAMNVAQRPEDLTQFEVDPDDLLKFCLVFSPESEVALNVDALWRHDPELAVGLCMVLLSARFLATYTAHSKREQILPWLTERLQQVQDIEQLPLAVLHDLYMHCSYADRPDKHAVKRSINQLIRRKLLNVGFVDSVFELSSSGSAQYAGESTQETVIYPQATTSAKPAPAMRSRAQSSADGAKRGNLEHKRKRPVLLVVLEWFTSSHSIFRTHSKTLAAARERFEVVGMSQPAMVDATSRGIFDVWLPLPAEQPLLMRLGQIQEEARRRRIDVLYMPSVGMDPLTIWLSNLRVAPLQVMGLGHPATAHAHALDYVVVEDDYVGDPACFSESLIRLPPDGMPYRPSAAMAGHQPRLRLAKSLETPINIAICATTMKLNPNFLATCARIGARAQRPLHFLFLIGSATGLMVPYVRRVVTDALGARATVLPHQPYQQYLDVLAGCDLFINPFPFGNTNGIVDAVAAGLVGVCRTGPEVHEHIDGALFRRLGWPDWLVAPDTESYVKAVLRLVTQDAERLQLEREFSGVERLDRLFTGRPEIFGERLYAMVEAHHRGRASTPWEIDVCTSEFRPDV